MYQLVSKRNKALDRLNNIFSIKRFSNFPGSATITKKWLIVATFGVYILLPCSVECAFLDVPHLPTKTSHSNSLIGIVFNKDFSNDLTIRQSGF